MIWPAELKLLNEMAVASRVDELNDRRLVYLGSNTPTVPARGVVDGQTLVLNTTYGIHAVGLLTGRRLWSRRFDPPLVKQQDRAGSDAWLSVHDGYVISVDKSGQLDVARTTNGDRLLWSRKRPGRHWFAVRARGPYVVAVDEKLEGADVYRLDDGRYLGACQFKQDSSRRVNLLLFDDVCCGPASDDEVHAMELATPGVERWRVQADAGLAQLFKPSPDVLAIADRRGGVQLVDPATGNRRMSTVNVKACESGVNDGTLQGGVLYVSGYKRRRTNEEQQRWGLAAVGVQDRTVIWQRDDLGPWACLNQEVLECAANVIPLAVLTSDNTGQAQPSFNNARVLSISKLQLSLLDKATGNKIGERIDVPLENNSGASRAPRYRSPRPGAGDGRRRPVAVPVRAALGVLASSAHRNLALAGESESAAGPDAGKNSEMIYP